MCNSPFCGEITFNRAMADAYTAGQESVIQAVTESLKEVLEPERAERLRGNLRYPELFAQAVADLVALNTIDDIRLTKWDTEKNRWKMGFWTGRKREREYVLSVIEDYSRNPGNLLLRENLHHIWRIMDEIKSEPLKGELG